MAPGPATQPRGRAQPTASEEARHSLRLKAKEVAGKTRGGKSGATSGNVIISTFPYIHLSDTELVQLYDISGFKLGHSEEENLDTVKKLRSLSYSKFQSSLSDILSTKQPVTSNTHLDLRPYLTDSLENQHSSNG